MNAQAGVQAAMTEINNQKANVEAAKANDLANQAQRDDAVEIAKQNAKLKGVIPDREIEASQNAAKVAIARYSQATSQIGQAQAQLQISQSKLKQAQAAVAQAQAQLEQANVNFQHSIITSPIDGVVVSRSVDVGQTVAASLSAPTLFTIANDLTNMQVLASIDEADVGQVHEGIQAHFTVDAFPGPDIYRRHHTGQTQCANAAECRDLSGSHQRLKSRPETDAGNDGQHYDSRSETRKRAASAQRGFALQAGSHRAAAEGCASEDGRVSPKATSAAQ